LETIRHDDVITVPSHDRATGNAILSGNAGIVVMKSGPLPISVW
jgi:hypothetical protein